MPLDIDSVLHTVFTFQVEDLGWTAFSILSLSVFFIYSVSAVGNPRPLASLKFQRKSHNYLAQARKIMAEKAALIELEQRRMRIRESWATKGFPFKRLPPELQLIVLGCSAEWWDTYCSLVLVSRYVYHSTLRACIPSMPITLSSTKQLTSFANLMHRTDITLPPLPINVATLVHYLWVSPLRGEDNLLVYRILRACTNVRVLACNAQTLAAAIAKPPKFRHKMCRDLTLLLSRPQWETTMDTPSGLLFLRQLTHLRVMGEQTLPRELSLEKLTHLSYPERRSYDIKQDDEDVRPGVLDQHDIFPSLQQVVVTRKCGSKGSPSRRIDSKLVVHYIPREKMEIGTWCDGARGDSIWDGAARAMPIPKKSDPPLAIANSPES